MSKITIEEPHVIVLPSEICEKYGIREKTVVELVETKYGLLLVPPTLGQLDPRFREELEAWEAASDEAWAMIDTWEKDSLSGKG